MVLSFTVRWYGGVRGGGAAAATAACSVEYGADGGDARSSTFVAMFAVPLAGYLVWQLIYILVTEVVFRGYLDSDPSIQTSLRWLTRDDRNGMHRLVRSACRRVGVFARDETFEPGTPKTLAVFCGAQFIYTAVCLLPPMLLRESFAAHCALVGALVFIMVWNGATYYIEVFTVRYRQQFAKLKRRASAAKSAAEAEALAEAAKKKEAAASNVRALDAALLAADANNTEGGGGDAKTAGEDEEDEALLLALVGGEDGALPSGPGGEGGGALAGAATPPRRRGLTVGVPDAGPHGTPLAGTALTGHQD